MPKMGGSECLKELKKNKTLRNIPVIIYSTSEYKLDKEVTKDLGADYFLTKLSDIYPLPEELIEAILAIPIYKTKGEAQLFLFLNLVPMYRDFILP